VALRSGDELFDDPYLTWMLEAGIIVTYGRIFASGNRYTPVPREWVPPEHHHLHRELMDRRHRYHAHTDLATSNPHRRNAADAGGEWFMVGYPDRLAPAQLDELGELARKLHVRIDSELPRPESDE
jgi:hypothetical protein